MSSGPILRLSPGFPLVDRTRLGELDIATHDPSAPADAPAPSHTVTILLRVTTPAAVHADFGASADKDTPGLAALTTLLRDAGVNR